MTIDCSMLLALWIGLTLGNMVWQIVAPSHDFMAAIERSFFQGVALIAVYISLVTSPPKPLAEFDHAERQS